MSNPLRDSGSGQPGARIESTCVMPPAQCPSSSSIPQIVNWNGINSISATARVLRLALLGASEYPMVVANLCTILRAGRSYDARCPGRRGAVWRGRAFPADTGNPGRKSNARGKIHYNHILRSNRSGLAGENGGNSKLLKSFMNIANREPGREIEGDLGDAVSDVTRLPKVLIDLVCMMARS